MSNLTGGGRLWPMRPKPLPDELLSSWIVRLAAAHDLKPHMLTSLTWPGKPVWNRDIDVSPDEDLLDTLAERTGVSPDRVRGTSFADFDGVLYVTRSPSGPSRWILPVGLSNWDRKAFGLQYCPECLAEDAEPYFRRVWRLACITVCVRHDRVLLNRCPKCGVPVVFFRSPRRSRTVEPMSLCQGCRFDLRATVDADRGEIPENLPLLQRRLERALRERWVWIPQRGFVQAHLYFTGLRLVLRLLATGSVAARFRAVVCEHFGLPHFEVHIPKNKDHVEQLGPEDRRRLLTLALTLLSDWPDGFVEVCREARVFTSVLLPYKGSVPFWYWSIVHNHLDKTKYEPTVEEIAWYIAKNHEVFGGRYVPPNRRVRFRSVWNAEGININPFALQARRRRGKLPVRPWDNLP